MSRFLFLPMVLFCVASRAEDKLAPEKICNFYSDMAEIQMIARPASSLADGMESLPKYDPNNIDARKTHQNLVAITRAAYEPGRASSSEDAAKDFANEVYLACIEPGSNPRLLPYPRILNLQKP